MQGRVVAVNDLGLRLGEDHQNARWTDHEVSLVLDLREEGGTYTEISKAMEMPKSTVADICKYRRRAQTPAKWVRINE